MGWDRMDGMGCNGTGIETGIYTNTPHITRIQLNASAWLSRVHLQDSSVTGSHVVGTGIFGAMSAHSIQPTTFRLTSVS
jgi:hypothetical protein